MREIRVETQKLIRRAMEVEDMTDDAIADVVKLAPSTIAVYRKRWGIPNAGTRYRRVKEKAPPVEEAQEVEHGAQIVFGADGEPLYVVFGPPEIPAEYAKHLLFSPEQVEMLARQLRDLRREIGDRRRVCSDHGYYNEGARCPSCEEEKENAA